MVKVYVLAFSLIGITKTFVSMLECMCLVRIPLLADYNDRSAELILDVANYIYENPTVLDLSLQGIWLSDGT